MNIFKDTRKSITFAQFAYSYQERLLFFADTTDLSSADPDNLLIPVQRDRFRKELRPFLIFLGFMQVIRLSKKKELPTFKSLPLQEAVNQAIKSMWEELDHLLAERSNNEEDFSDEHARIYGVISTYFKEVRELEIADKSRKDELFYAGMRFASRVFIEGQEELVQGLIVVTIQQFIKAVEGELRNFLKSYRIN